MNQQDNLHPDWASPPGETLAELLRQQKISVSEFAQRVGRSERYIQSLLDGSEALTTEMASQLAANVGGSVQFWLARESQYRSDLAALESANPAMSEDAFVQALPIKDMKKWKWLGMPASSDDVHQSLRFFDVPNIGVWQARYYESPALTAFRTSPTFRSETGAVAAWLRRGEIEAASIKCEPWSPELFRQTLSRARQLTRKKDPGTFIPELQRMCANCGVAVVAMRAPGGCRASGAARFLSEKKALLLLSFRHLSDDHFWFTFFHEAGHLMLHDKHMVFVDGANGISAEQEREANEFAASTLVPHEFHKGLSSLPVDARKVIRFAREVGVSPGVVVGQLQHLGRLRRNQLNTLKRRYRWVDDSD